MEAIEDLRFPKKKGGKPLYEQICAGLRESIATAAIPSGYQLPNVSRLARKWDVHYRTVRAAFDLLEQEGVISSTPNRRAVVALNPGRKTATRRKVAVAHIRMHDDAFALSLAEGVNQFSCEHGIEFEMLDARDSHERFLQAITQSVTRLDGLLFLPHELPEYKLAIETALRSGTAVVFMDRNLPGVNASCVSSDHVGGAYSAAKHLLKQHGRPVYHIGCVSSPSSCRDWVRGWSAAMLEYGFSNTKKYCYTLSQPEAAQVVSSKEWLADVGMKDMHKFFDSHEEDVFCVFAGNDYVAQLLCDVAVERGRVVGQDIFVVGFGNLPFAERMPVPLTSVDEHPIAVGYNAAKVLYESILGLHASPVSRLIPTTLNVRQSSVNPRNPNNASVAKYSEPVPVSSGD